MVESPRAVVVVEDVVVSTDELDRPAGSALQNEDHVANRDRLVIAPLGDEGVDDQVALGALGLPPGVGLAEGVVAPVGTQARDLTDAVGAEGGDDVVGSAVVESMRVPGDGG